MNSPTTSTNVDEPNQKALATLARSITVSQGRFALMLVRCNYTSLRHRLAQQIKVTCPVQIQELTLPRSPNNLWQPLANATAHQKQRALMVYGLEDVENLAELLANLESEQGELSGRCQMPVVLWLTEDSLSMLVKLAPGLYSSTITAITLRASATELDVLWRESSDRLFADLLDRGVETFVSNEDIGFCEKSKIRRELQAATRDLKNAGTLPPALAATWQFILGRDEDQKKNIGEALVRYQKSLNIWEQLQNQTINGNLQSFTVNSLQSRWALVKLHMGQCYYQQSLMAGSVGHPNLQLAKDTFLAVVRIFARQQRFELCWQVMNLAGKTLCALGQWLELENIAHAVLSEEGVEELPLNQAQAYGFLAEIALHHSDFERALEQANLALKLSEAAAVPAGLADNSVGIARYLLQIAKVEARSHDFAGALEKLEKAQLMVDIESDLQLYLDIKQELRLLFYHTGQFWESFQIKQQQQILRYQKGLSAFVGNAAAQDKLIDIAIIGREEDVSILVDRFSSDQKLVILHGDNGIGKGSLLKCGVIPVLQRIKIDQCPVVVASQKTYGDWRTMLLESILQASGRPVIPGVATVDAIQQELAINLQSNLCTILIFRHFEDFFLAVPDVFSRQEFFLFFRDCLMMPQVKICIAINPENLYRLLEFEQFGDLSVIGNNILDRQWRYQLRNLSLEQARTTIDRVTGNCRYYLEPALSQQLVQDLANSHGEISPLQLQIIGAQLQNENVRTMGQYLQLSSRPQQYLLERALDEAIRDCGRENQVAVVNVLHLLIDGQGQRPERSFSQLLPATSDFLPPPQQYSRSYHSSGSHHNNHYAQLLLLLNILVGSGLVYCTKHEPENRYQLMHSSLIEKIQASYNSSLLPENRSIAPRLRNVRSSSRQAWQNLLQAFTPFTYRFMSRFRGWKGGNNAPDRYTLTGKKPS
jgi:tetratricopeptide (TPR) repeat protein